ncbi:MAG TPA: hypothetical protein VGD98_12125 [Ktedonobacteraceae bacterium]
MCEFIFYLAARWWVQAPGRVDHQGIFVTPAQVAGFQAHGQKQRLY